MTTLKEKFLPFVDWMNLQEDCISIEWSIRNAEKCEKIADDYAIEFLDDIRDYERENGSRICFDERDSKELLEMFKKQKGL